MEHIAVIDLGSNTFHIIIARRHKSDFSIVFRERIFTALSDGGTEWIKEERSKHGLSTLKYFKEKCVQYNVSTIQAIGTAVLRKANNRAEFIQQAENILGCQINIISGHREAELITKGILLLKEVHLGRHLIMDIGGGSTEFIIIENGNPLWSKSFPIGVGVLHEKYHHNEPIDDADIHQMANEMQPIMVDIRSACHTFGPIDCLIGASGSFEVLENIHRKSSSTHEKVTKISIADFFTTADTIIRANYEERNRIDGIPPERIKLIVVGILLKKMVIEHTQPRHILVSPYALKEGVLSEWLA